MDTPQPGAKRRRLNASVNKPFKSPLRTPLKANANPPSASPLSTAPVKVSSEALEVSENTDLSSHTKISSHLIKRSLATSAPSNPLPSSSAPSDPAIQRSIQDVTKSNRSLESSILRARQDIDTLQQALSILTSSKGTELEGLADRWRKAARLAAEEIFGGARDRVNRMGGVGAWRERERESKNRQWEEEPVRNTGGSGDDEDEGGGGYEREKEKEDRDERVEEEGWEYDHPEKEDKQEDTGQDDDSFTMDMMLKMMNIDLELIGYDKRRQMWVG